MSDTSPVMPTRGTRRRRRQFSWLEQTLAAISGALEQAIFTEELARRPGWLQMLDPRVKLLMFLVTVLAASFSRGLLTLVMLYLMLLLLAWESQVPFNLFVRRVWLGIPFFAGIVILPSIFFTMPPRLFNLAFGPIQFGPSLASLLSALTFVMRVGVTVSLATLLILTTPWPDLLKSLHTLRVPQVFILLLAMTYRYLFLFLHTLNGLFEGRKSRVVGYTTGREQRRWISGSMVHLLHRSFFMSQAVYTAMVARGFQGDIRICVTYRLTRRDWLALTTTFCAVAGVFFLERYVP